MTLRRPGNQLREPLPYVVLEYVQPRFGARFWTMNQGDNCHLDDGTVAYREIAFTDDSAEAINLCGSRSSEGIATL